MRGGCAKDGKPPTVTLPRNVAFPLASKAKDVICEFVMAPPVFCFTATVHPKSPVSVTITLKFGN